MFSRNALSVRPPKERVHDTSTSSIKRPTRCGRMRRATVSTSGSSGIDPDYPARDHLAVRCPNSSKKDKTPLIRKTRTSPLSVISPRRFMSHPLLTIGLSLALSLTSSASQGAHAAPRVERVDSGLVSTSSAWRTNPKDNICGLTSPRQLTQPARIDYRTALASTPEMKDLKRRGISLDSAEGQILRERAADRVRMIGSKLMKRKGHCSLWKEISHSNNRLIPDITSELVTAIAAS